MDHGKLYVNNFAFPFQTLITHLLKLSKNFVNALVAWGKTVLNVNGLLCLGKKIM